MKVLFINTVFGRGSTGRIVSEIGAQVEAQGGSYMVAYGRGEKSNDPHAFFMGSKTEYYLHALLTRISDKCGFYSKTATRKLVRFIRNYQPDVIHLHNLHGYYLNVEILFHFLKTEFTGKVVWTLHDCWAFTGHCVHFTIAGCDKWKTGCYGCPQKNTYPVSNLRDNSRNNYAKKKALFTGVPNMTVVTVSKWLKETAEQSFLKDYPIKCVYNGIDDRKFHPAENSVKKELGIEGKKMILLVSDGWNEQKGFGKTLETARLAHPDWHFVMVGVSKEQTALLPENITGIDGLWQPGQLTAYYSAADVFFNPSLEETFGLVTAEAIACGTPAVVMNSTACPEPLNGYGVVLDTFTPETALKAIEECLNIPKNQSVNHFTLEKMTAGYLACYEQ